MVLENSDTFGEQVTAVGDAALELCTSALEMSFKSTAQDQPVHTECDH